MSALIPTIDEDAAAQSPQTFSKVDIEKREMKVHQACIGVIVQMLNMYSETGGNVDVFCLDRNVYSMLIIKLCLALDHEETEKHCLKAANSCPSCDCAETEFASWSRRPGYPKLVEARAAVIQKIEQAATELLTDQSSAGAWALGSV